MARRSANTPTPGPDPAVSDDELNDAWARTMTLLIQRRDEFFGLLRRHDLTPPHGHALQVLHGGPLRMRDMADAVACDASYITAIVDRLERASLVERRPCADDRRAKEIVLTTAGRRLARELSDLFDAAPAALQRLDDTHRRHFVDVMRVLVPELGPDEHLFRPPRP
jgi:DNA-binding MarR family transcriptional regulator